MEEQGFWKPPCFGDGFRALLGFGSQVFAFKAELWPFFDMVLTVACFGR